MQRTQHTVSEGSVTTSLVHSRDEERLGLLSKESTLQNIRLLEKK